MTYYISAPSLPGSIGVGRTAYGVSYAADSMTNWVAEVDAIMPGDTQIDVTTYAVAVAANATHNALLPAAARIVAPPSLPELLAPLFTAIGNDPALDAATKAAISQAVAFMVAN